MLICQISDLHIKARGQKAYGIVDTTTALRHCIASIRALPQSPDVVVITGDLVDLGQPEEYAALAAILGEITQPIFLLPGNHDEREALCAAFPTHRYLRRQGERLNYVIEDFAVRLVALDTIIPGESGGMIDPETATWLEHSLASAPARPTLVMMHHPPFSTGIGHMDQIGLTGRELLAPVISRNAQVERIICGHLHRCISTRFAGTIASTCPSPAHQVMLDLSPEAREGFVMEPPGYQLHWWRPAFGLVTHTVAIGDYPGPYPFGDESGVID